MRSVDIHYCDEASCEEVQTQGWQELNDHKGYHVNWRKFTVPYLGTEINADEIIFFRSNMSSYRNQ
jgi:hypothetical protein